MEINPIANITPAPISKVESDFNNFNKQQLSLVDTSIKDKSAISLSQNVKDYLYTNSNPSPLSSFADNKVKFNDFNIDVKEAYKPLSSGEMIPLYDNFIQGTNNEERFANQQSTADKWGNGLLKFAGKTLTAVVGGTVGTINGVSEGIRSGSFQATYDNDFNDWLDDLNTKMDYRLPNYYTEQEKAQNFGQNLGSANFWANDVLGGLSFTVGTVVSEGIWAYATGGGSLSTAAARTGLRAGKFFGEGAALTRALNKSMAIVKAPILKTFARPNLPVDIAKRFGQAGELANTLRFTYTSAGFEAGVEARHYMKESRDTYLSSFQDQNGRLPNSEEVAAFEQNLTDSANSLYGFNLALVGSSNLAIFGKMLNVSTPKFPAKWANEALFGIGMRKGATGELEKIAATKLQTAFSKAYAIGRVPVIEGLWEEGQQSVGNNTASNWIKSTYDPKYLGNSMDIGTAFTEGLAETYGSKEGWKEIGIGMIIGLISGTGTNLARGRGVFADVNDANRRNDQEIQMRNSYSAEKLIDRIHTANRVQSFTEAQDQAERVGDITGAELSRKSALIAHVNNAYNYDYVQEAYAEVSTAIETMDTATLMKQYNLTTEQEVTDLKKTLLEDYKATSDSFVKHREFTEYFINPREFKDMAETNRVREAVAYELTLGEHAHNFSKDLLEDIKKEVAGNYTATGQAISNSLAVQDILWSAERGVRRDFVTAQKQLRAAKREKSNLEKERLSLEANKNSKEDNTSTLNRLNKVVADLAAKDEQVLSLTSELQGILSTAQLQNPYNNESEPFVTDVDLENVDTNLNQISTLIDTFRRVSPQRANKLEGLITEYSKSKTAFTRYADLARQLSDPTLGLKGRRNIISELISDKTPSVITLEFLEGMQEGMSRSVSERALEAVESSAAVNNVINRARMTAPSTEAAPKAFTVQDIINKNAYLLEYVGTDTEVNKPTDEEVEEYKALVKKIRRARNINNEAATTINPEYYSKKGIKTKVTPQELARFQELNQNMSDWRLFEGALNDEGISIVDLINQELSKQQEIDGVVVQDELTEEDYVSVATPTEALPTKNGVEFRDASIIQTYENIKVRVFGDNYEFSHMNLSTLFSRIPAPFGVLMQSPSKFDENGYAVEWNKPLVVSVDEAIDNQKVGGTLFTVQMEEGNVQVVVTNQSRIQIPLRSFNAVKGVLGLDLFKQLATKNSYSDLYALNEDNEYVQMESDFTMEDNSGTVSYLPDELYQLEINSNTFFKVNVNDAYNEKLKADFETDKITYDQLVDLVKVYNISGNNKVIGDLKSNQDIADPNPVFLEIRKRAADVLLNDQVAESLITIPYTAKVQYVLLGTPNITMTKTEDGVVPQTQPITEQALTAIVDFGYLENGTLNLRNETKSVRTDFVDKLGKKVNLPVVVFKQGKFLVAYPVSLVKRPAERANEVANILTNRRLNNAQKATQINNYLAQNRISPKDYGLYYVSETDQNMFDGNEMSTQLNMAVEAINGIQDFVDVSAWLSPDYTKENLMADAVISIDLTNRPLRSPKVIIDFNEASSTESPLSWYEEWVNTGTITDEKVNEIASKVIAEGINADGLNALSQQENEVFVSETEKINAAIETIYRMTEDKKKQAEQEKRKNC